METARLAWFWSAKDSTFTDFFPLFLHLAAWVWASVCSVVPLSTATVCPHSAASPLGFHELPALT